MTRTFTYSFEQYPIRVVEDGFEIGMADGEAEIAFTMDGEWSIQSISLTGSRANKWHEREFAKVAGKVLGSCTEKLYCLDDGSTLHKWMLKVLEGHKREDVQEAVREQIEEEHISAADYVADARRAHMEASL